MSKRILVIGGGFAQLPLVEACIELGLYTIVIDERDTAPAKHLASKIIPYNRYDEKNILDIVPKLDLDAVVSGGSDKAVYLMAKCAELYGLEPYVPSDIAVLPMQKNKMRSLLEGLDLPVPITRHVDSIEKAILTAETIGYPVVIKPVEGIGQLGVHRIDTPEMLINKFHNAYEHSPTESVLIQSFIEGQEVGVNGFVLNDKFKLLTVGFRNASRKAENAFGVALEKKYPAVGLERYHNDIEHIIGNACKGLGITNSPIYAQMILTASTIKIIEIMPRLGGGEDPRLVHAATGFNIAKATVLSALKMPILESNLIDASNHSAVTIKFMTVKPGTITNVSGLESARHMPNILKAEVFYCTGHYVDELRSSRERVGYVLAVGRSPEEADKAAIQAINLIDIETSN